MADLLSNWPLRGLREGRIGQVLAVVITTRLAKWNILLWAIHRIVARILRSIIIAAHWGLATHLLLLLLLLGLSWNKGI